MLNLFENKKGYSIRIYCNLLIFNVIQTGFEPVTRSLEGCCSIQLSYWTNILMLYPPPYGPDSYRGGLSGELPDQLGSAKLHFIFIWTTRHTEFLPGDRPCVRYRL